MTAISKPIKGPYADTFIFLQDYLTFLPSGLPVDSSTRGYYQRRTQAQHTPETIGFSVFLHAIWHCFTPAVESICLSSIAHQPEWISAFWQDTDPIVLNPTVQNNRPAFVCEVLDLRHCQHPLPELLKNLPKITASQAAVFLITDQAPPSTAKFSQQTPFGIVSFFNKNDWKQYYESLM